MNRPTRAAHGEALEGDAKPRQRIGRTILVDTREQRPLLDVPEDGTETELVIDQVLVRARRSMLKTADYALADAGEELLIERKSSALELATCCGAERQRFTRELERMVAETKRAVLLCEFPISDLEQMSRSKLNARTVVATLASWHLDFGICPVFAGDRRGAARWLVRTFAALDRRLAAAAEATP